MVVSMHAEISPTECRSSSIPVIAFVQALWHRDIVDQARDGFLAQVGDQATVEVFEVPGAFELPLHARCVADSGRFDAVVAAGFVVDGGIYRHEFVADAVISGLMRVQLDTGVPVFSSVLTPQQFHESPTHVEFFRNHMVEKGHEVAAACLQTLEARSQIFALA
ncbi:MAG: 6,7-dimethyl-8-ribityllumazine synthase [Acidimicrobiales bacterium]|jgi:6,7-dimethyl-8-ribityllumazine synthase